jgi:hypothetical protein
MLRRALLATLLATALPAAALPVAAAVHKVTAGAALRVGDVCTICVSPAASGRSGSSAGIL